MNLLLSVQYLVSSCFVFVIVLCYHLKKRGLLVLRMGIYFPEA